MLSEGCLHPQLHNTGLLECTTGIGAGRHRSSRTWRNIRLLKPPRPEQKQPLRGGAEHRPNRNQREPLGTAADPGKLNGKAATLQEKRGLSRYGERYKGKGREDGRYGKTCKKGKEKGTRHGEHYEGRENKGRHGEHYEGRENKGGCGMRSTAERGRGKRGHDRKNWEEAKQTEE
ncbi:hypothetical protein NDU88_011525 [Pleurodeles waltl]|uniref:Uncharacterized protein n=1 Tax=Pleurodeles waltl TaxID=8319 RepID=A0AAV7Q4Z6_PLEWA|nr:hypothetical protein NDU88_011525 [Pleurodeles waltl]